MITTRRILVLGTAALVAGACGRADAAPDATVPASAPAAANDSGLVAGTPAGGLEDWVSQVAEGLGKLNEQVSGDVQSAQKIALDLYVTRQEYIEMYWGAQGRLRGEGTEALSALVLGAEDAFHDLLQQLAAEPVEAVAIRATTDSINSRLGRALEEARARGVALIPPGNPPVGGEGAGS